MTLPTSTIAFTAGSGTVTAAELVSSKYYGVAMLAGRQGHILGTRPSYIMLLQPIVCAANKVFFDFFNASGSGVTVALHGLFFNCRPDVVMASALGVRLDIYRTSAIGTGGSAIGYEQTSVTDTISAIDPADAASLPTSYITCRTAPTGGATIDAWMGQAYMTTEEVSTNFNYHTQFRNMLRYEGMADLSNLILPQGYGIKAIQGPVAITVPYLGFRLIFTTREP